MESESFSSFLTKSSVELLVSLGVECSYVIDWLFGGFNHLLFFP
jgi:hypothetical protein